MDNPIKADVARLAAVIRRLPAKAAATAENFFKDRFRAGGWEDAAFEPWRKRKADKPQDNGRAILVKSGALRRSVRSRAKGMVITTSSSLPYAEAHNEGFKGEVTDEVAPHTRRSHRRKGYTRSDGRAVSEVVVKEHGVGAFARKRNVSLPQRRFMGPSVKLDRAVNALIDKEILGL